MSGDIQNIETNNAKCEGIGCAYKHSCGRFTRTEQPEQQWASYYALTDTDCEYFEVVATTK